MDPADEAQISDELSRSTKAEAILANPLVKAALEAVYAKADGMWKRANPAKPEELQAAAMLYQAAETFKSNLEQHVRTGKLAKAKLESSRNSSR